MQPGQGGFLRLSSRPGHVVPGEPVAVLRLELCLYDIRVPISFGGHFSDEGRSIDNI